MCLVPIIMAASLLVTVVHAGSSNDYLEQHNLARKEVGVAPLTWSANLTAAAANLGRYQRIKFRCQFANLTSSRKYGANQLRAGGMAVTPLAAVQHWVAQKQYYDHPHNTCVKDHPTCGVYTEVVWGNTTELGCTQATCAEDTTSLTICLYNPPGNVVGQAPY